MVLYFDLRDTSDDFSSRESTLRKATGNWGLRSVKRRRDERKGRAEGDVRENAVEKEKGG